MLKTVTCSLATIERTAKQQGVVVGRDVVIRPVNAREVAVRGDTLEGQLLLSLLVTAHFG